MAQEGAKESTKGEMDALRRASEGATLEVGDEDRLEKGDDNPLVPRSPRRRGRRRRSVARVGRKGNPQKRDTTINLQRQRDRATEQKSKRAKEQQREKHPHFLQRGRNR